MNPHTVAQTREGTFLLEEIPTCVGGRHMDRTSGQNKRKENMETQSKRIVSFHFPVVRGPAVLGPRCRATRSPVDSHRRAWRHRPARALNPGGGASSLGRRDASCWPPMGLCSGSILASVYTLFKIIIFLSDLFLLAFYFYAGWSFCGLSCRRVTPVAVSLFCAPDVHFH